MRVCPEWLSVRLEQLPLEGLSLEELPLHCCWLRLQPQPAIAEAADSAAAVVMLLVCTIEVVCVESTAGGVRNDGHTSHTRESLPHLQ